MEHMRNAIVYRKIPKEEWKKVFQIKAKKEQKIREGDPNLVFFIKKIETEGYIFF